MSLNHPLESNLSSSSLNSSDLTASPARRIESMPKLGTLTAKDLSILRQSFDQCIKNNKDCKPSSTQKDFAEFRERSVSFDSVSVRIYEIGLADNPGMTCGPPIGLSWDYISEDSFEFLPYETERQPKRVRNYLDLYMSKHHRKYLLKQKAGLTDEEIKQASKQAKHYRFRRSIIGTLSPIFIIIEMIGSVKKNLCCNIKLNRFGNGKRNLSKKIKPIEETKG